MLNIVIPMAGFGRRFSEQGYTDPKPLIPIQYGDQQIPMIQLVLQNLLMNLYHDRDDIRIYIIVREDFYQNNLTKLSEIDLKIKEMFGVHHICFASLPNPTLGAADTILKGLLDLEDGGHIDLSLETIIRNCDDLWLDVGGLQNAINYWRLRKADGGIVCFTANDPKWSFAVIDPITNKIVQVAEKSAISNYATFGCYYFRTGYLLLDGIEEMMTIEDTKVNNEYYLCPVFNELIRFKHNVVPYLANDIVGVGTPEDLKLYEERVAK